MKEKMSQQAFLTLVDDFLNEQGIWPDFVQELESRGYKLDPEKPLDEQIEITN